MIKAIRKLWFMHTWMREHSDWNETRQKYKAFQKALKEWEAANDRQS